MASGLPVFGAFALFGGAYYLNTQLDYGIPPQAIALATQVCTNMALERAP